MNLFTKNDCLHSTRGPILRDDANRQLLPDCRIRISVDGPSFNFGRTQEGFSLDIQDLLTCEAKGQNSLLENSLLENSLLENSLLENSLLESSLLESSLLESSLLENSLLENSLLENSLLENSLIETSLFETSNTVCSNFFW